MKKLFLLVPVAALVMTACTSESTESVGAAQQPKEISFMPIAQPSTRADVYNAVSDAVFPDNYVMQVSANLNASGVYFHNITFEKGDGSTWKGATSQYWPLSASTLNFLAVTKWPASYSKDIVGTTFTNSRADGATIVLGDNKPSTVNSQDGSQHDLMYAVGRGIVTQTDNSLSYTGNAAGNAAPVDMEFKHALAWVNFTAKSNVAGFTLRSITLNNAYYGGTYTITNNDNKDYTYDASSTNSKTPTAVTGTWTLPTDQASVAVPGWDAAAVAVSPATATAIGNGLIVVPTNGIGETKSFMGFTIAYTFNGQNFTYTYSSPTVLEQAKKYTYDITFTLTEIEINPSVSNWDAVSSTPVAVP